MSISAGKILIIGTDISMLDPNSPAGARIREYAGLFEEYHMVIYTGRGFKQERAMPLFLYPTNSRFYFMRPFDAFRIAKKIIKERGIKMVSVQDPAETGIAGWFLKKALGVKLHIQIHADFFSPRFRKNSWKERLRYWLARFIIPSGDKFRVVSKRIANSLNSAFSIQHSALSVLPIFVDCARIADAGPSFNLHNKYPQFDFIILMVSRLTREKNIGMALEAFSEFVKSFPKSGLVIVGDGPERNGLGFSAKGGSASGGRVSSLGFADKVCFEGWQDDLVSYYKGADIYLLTSNFEGYGRTVLEAAAAGCPVVMTDVGVAGDIIRDGETGRVIGVKDAQKLAGILKWARQNNQKMRQMAERAQEEVLALSPKTQNEYLLMYKESFGSI
ncbi:MAG: glycosyltransferase [Candidatus Sungbacteria bacterium]|nr:glycosyltransferase [Candidatus Sungbacteria bacterium]